MAFAGERRRYVAGEEARGDEVPGGIEAQAVGVAAWLHEDVDRGGGREAVDGAARGGSRSGRRGFGRGRLRHGGFERSVRYRSVGRRVRRGGIRGVCVEHRSRRVARIQVGRLRVGEPIDSGTGLPRIASGARRRAVDVGEVEDTLRRIPHRAFREVERVADLHRRADVGELQRRDAALHRGRVPGTGTGGRSRPRSAAPPRGPRAPGRPAPRRGTTGAGLAKRDSRTWKGPNVT